MSSELDKIEEVFPGAKEHDIIVSLTESLKDAKDRRIMAQSEAGQIVSKELWDKCMDLVTALRVEYMEGSEMKLRSLCAALDVQMALYDELVNAEFIEEAARTQLDEAVKQELVE